MNGILERRSLSLRGYWGAPRTERPQKPSIGLEAVFRPLRLVSTNCIWGGLEQINVKHYDQFKGR